MVLFIYSADRSAVVVAGVIGGVTAWCGDRNSNTFCGYYNMRHAWTMSNQEEETV